MPNPISFSSATVGRYKIADINKDGLSDLIVATTKTQLFKKDETNLSVALRLKSGGFGNPILLTTTSGSLFDSDSKTVSDSSQIQIGDVNKDGKPDICFGYYNSNGYNIKCWINNFEKAPKHFTIVE